MEYQIGYYELFGNTLEYDGDTVMDLDANEELPLEALDMAEYIGEEL
jgi:hypothetical protein